MESLSITLVLLLSHFTSSTCAKSNRPGHLRLDKNWNPWGTRWLQGLPEMESELHAPSSPAWNNSVAMCAVMKDEELEDIVEWLTYYRWLGVDHIFLTDNGSYQWNVTSAALAAKFPPTFVTLREETWERAQLKVYAWCAEEHRARYNWMAFFDLDEYLVLRDGAGEGAAHDPNKPNNPNIKTFLEDYKHTPGLAVHWVWVGPGARRTRPLGGGVLQHYKQCVPEADRHVKTIVNTWYLDGVAVNPHNFHYREGLLARTEGGLEVQEEWRVSPKCKQGGEAAPITPGRCRKEAAASAPPSPAFSTCCSAMAGVMVRQASVERVALFHYATKSFEDFTAKMERGSGMSFARKTDDYFESLREKQKVAPLCEEAASLWGACCGHLVQKPLPHRFASVKRHLARLFRPIYDTTTEAVSAAVAMPPLLLPLSSREELAED